MIPKIFINMFPYSSRINIKSINEIYIDFNKNSDGHYADHHFDSISIQRMFEKIKFSRKPIYVSCPADKEMLDQYKFNINLYGRIVDVYFYEDVIRVYLKILDTECGKIIKEMILFECINDYTDFFVTFCDNDEFKFVNLHPSFKNIVI